MKLQELSALKPSKQIAKVFESYFGSRIRFDQLTRGQTQAMLQKVQGVLREHRGTTARHHSEKNPKYLQLVMMEQALSSRLKEAALPAMPGAAPATGGVAAPAATSTAPNPALVAAKKKLSSGQTLSPQEQELINAQAQLTAESRLRRAMHRLNESEVQQAQVVLAAQDMVDKMQGMLEDVTELQFKELPALVDSIKNQVGMEQAQRFNADATAALAGLVGNLQGAKQQLDAALGVVTGQTPPAAAAGAMGADIAAGAADMNAAGADMAAADDMGADLDAELPPEPGMEPPAAALGRGRR